MGLPGFFGSKTRASSRQFLALDISPEVVRAGLWAVENDRVHVVKTSSAIEWTEERIEELAEAADVALEELGKFATEIDEVVLGVPEDWVHGQHIVEERKPLLRSLKDQLSLKPVGFVVTFEALVKYLQELEGGPISAILLELTTTTIQISIMKAGIRQASEMVQRSGDVVSDLAEGLARMTIKTLPARIMLYSARLKHEELENEKQTLLAKDWNTTTSFLHIPKIETLPQDILMSSVCISAGSQLKNALDLSQQEIPAEKTKPQAEVKEEHPSEAPITPVAHVAADLGFHDFQSMPAEAQEEKVKPDEVEETPAEEPMESNVVPVDQPAKRFVNPLPGILSAILKPFKSIGNTMFSGRTIREKFHTDVAGTKKLRIIVACVLIAVVLGGGIGLLVLRANNEALVSLTLKTEPITKDIEITLDPTASQTDPSTNVLKVSVIDREVTGEQEADTTGTKIVGDRAKGKVVLYNATSGEKTFAAGTVLSGPNGIKFTLNSAVTVASSSGSSLLNTELGKTTADVTASNIGSESNLPGKTEFTVANFDKKTYVAVNDDPMTGGSSREIQAVSKDDQQKLEKALLTELEAKALEELKSAQAEDQHLIPTDTFTTKDKSFSAKIGDEARTVKLTMTVSIRAISYTANDLLPIAQHVLEESLPENTVLRSEKTQIDPRQIEATKSGTMQLATALSSETIPTVDKKAIAEMLKGKTIQQATSLLAEKKEIASSNIQIRPKLAQMIFGSLPADVSKITIQTKVQ